MGLDKELKLKAKHPALIMLGALLRGDPMIVDREPWYLQDGVFGPKRVMEDSKTGEKTEILIGVDMSIGAFVQWCEKLPEDAILQTVFNTVLAMNKKERP